MAMSPRDDIFSVDEDFEDAEQALHPSLLPKATPIATNASHKRKDVDLGVAAAGTPQRGRAWRERDSILLMQTYAWIEETKKVTTFFNHHVLMKEWWAQSIQDINIYERWLSLCPEDNQTSSAVIARWKDMISMFKYFSPHIFEVHRLM